MIKLLMLAHASLFAASIVSDKRRGVERLGNLAIPVGLSFCYMSVVQAWSAMEYPGFGIDLDDIRVGLWVSLVSYLAFLVAYWSARQSTSRPLFTDEGLNVRRLNALGLCLCLVAMYGYYRNIRNVGGVAQYFGSAEVTVEGADLSGYIYMLKLVMYAGVAVLLFSLALDGLPKSLTLLMIFLMIGLLAEEVQRGQRSGAIRAGFTIIAAVYFASRRPRHRGGFVVLGNTMIMAVLVFIAAAVLLLPSMRGSQRKVSASEVTLAEAVERVKENKGSSRGADAGGEFDSGVRIIKRVNAREFKHPGPAHLAYVLWSVVPRALVPAKWEIFWAWAGKDYEEIRFGSISYYGCAPTGWGEAYGCMGWVGAILYWLAFGYGVRKFEGWIGGSRAGIIVSAICYLPLLLYVVMDFWAGSMTFCLVPLPVLVVLRLCQRKPVLRPTGNRPGSARPRMTRARPVSGH